MRAHLKRTLAAGTLLALVSSSAAGWSVAFHLATDDHHRGEDSNGGVIGLEMVLHGHSHAEGTPPHGHPLLVNAVAPIGEKRPLQVAVSAGAGPEGVFSGASDRHLLPPSGPTHDPPPRCRVVPVLRI